MKSFGWRSCILAATIVSGVSPADADAVGTAIDVKSRAAVEQPGPVRVLATGADVAQDETIRTDESGNANLKFVDETMLTIGPSSEIKLDKMLFTPERKAKSFVLQAVAGAFRFATGKSRHNAYEIKTPIATIGVRGTRFAFGIRGDEVTIVVTQGAVTSCSRTPNPTGPRCVNASAGNTIVATPTGAVVRRTLGAVPDVLRTVLTLPTPSPQVPDLRDAMRAIRPLDTPLLNRGLPAGDLSPPSAPTIGGGTLGGSLPNPGGLPSTGSVPALGGGVTPRLPGLGR